MANTELVKYNNKWGTRVVKLAPLTHRVNKLIAQREIRRDKQILAIDKKRLKHGEAQLRKAVTAKLQG